MEDIYYQKDLTCTASYSPEDNKLRIYASERLNKDLYNLFRSTGYGWAPKQKLFYAVWTPTREKLAIKMAGVIDDEQMTLAERAEFRAERFKQYQVNRANDSEHAMSEYENLRGDSSVIASSDNWRHQRKAQKKADKIERLGQRAIGMWETSEYWESRISRVLGNPDRLGNTITRVNRIKKLEKEKRKYTKYVDDAEFAIQLWTNTEKELTLKRATAIASVYSNLSMCFTLKEYPRDISVSQYEGSLSLYSALKDKIITPILAKNLSLASKEKTIKHYSQWINHITIRIDYENKILTASGYTKPEKPKRPKQPPLLNYRSQNGIDFKWYNRDGGKIKTYQQVSMSKAEYKDIYSERRGTMFVNGNHRIRIAIISDESDTRTGFYRRTLDVCVFLTDSKEHQTPC